jgi:hypothetical protein
MEYWKQERKLDAFETQTVFSLSKTIAAALDIKDGHIRQKIEIAITEFIISHGFQLTNYSKPTGENDERVVDSGEVRGE